MKTYTVLYAEDVPHYAAVEIQAACDEEAIAFARSCDFGDAALEPEWNNAVCKRIVHIEDDAGNILASGISLDGTLLLSGSDVRDAVRYALGCLHSFKADWLASHGLNVAVEKLEAAYSGLGGDNV